MSIANTYTPITATGDVLSTPGPRHWISSWAASETAGSSTVTLKVSTRAAVTPSAPVAALVTDSTASQLEAGAHLYKVTFTTAQGESMTSAASNSVTNDGTHTSNTVTIPVSTDPLVTGRKLYRTAAAGSTYVLAYTIANNTATTQVDTLPDASRSGTVVTVGTTGYPLFPTLTVPASGSVGEAFASPIVSMNNNALQTAGECIRVEVSGSGTPSLVLGGN